MMSLAEVRKSKGIPLTKIADDLNITQSSYFYYENGVRLVSREKAQQIADYLGVDMDEIFLPEKFSTTEYIKSHSRNAV